VGLQRAVAMQLDVGTNADSASLPSTASAATGQLRHQRRLLRMLGVKITKLGSAGINSLAAIPNSIIHPQRDVGDSSLRESCRACTVRVRVALLTSGRKRVPPFVLAFHWACQCEHWRSSESIYLQ
jgi:hypothetical protein